MFSMYSTAFYACATAMTILRLPKATMAQSAEPRILASIGGSKRYRSKDRRPLNVEE